MVQGKQKWFWKPDFQTFQIIDPKIAYIPPLKAADLEMFLYIHINYKRII
jgi:hypothetical protein